MSIPDPLTTGTMIKCGINNLVSEVYTQVSALNAII